MMFGYYGRTGYLNMYAGPTNGGVCPLDNSDWGSSECPLSATHQGYDGLAVKGHVDDYWYAYGSTVDSYYGYWAEHGYADCTADFMGTNQYVNWQNVDGSTRFYYYNNGNPLYDYSGCEPGGKRDGCHGIRLFVESRGYNVVQNYNQYIHEHVAGGFTYANFKAEIDAGRPVIIHVTDHSMLGYGYTDPDTIYIHDTWDHTDHSMSWGGTYAGMEHYGVTVIVVPYLCGNMNVNPTSWSPTILCGNTDNEIVTVSASDGVVEGVTVSKESGPTWLSVSPTNLGDIPSGSSKTFTMTASPPSGTSGDFTYTVRVSNTCGTPSSRDVTGTIHVKLPSETVVSIEDASAPQGGTVTVPINIAGVENMCGANIWLNYEKNVVIVDSVSDGDLVPLTHNIDNTAGVTKMNWDTTSGMTGDFVFAYVTLKAVGNQGDTCLLDLDVKELYDCVPPFNEIPHTVAEGTFTVRANIVPKPDLIITEKWLCWPDNCTICYNVTNIGDGTAPACHNTALYVDGVEVAYDHVPVDLAPGESYIGCFDGYTWMYTPPSDNITVCADNNETLVELYEDNNGLTDIWMCGDVTGDGKVRTSDGIRIFRHLTFGDPLNCKCSG